MRIILFGVALTLLAACSPEHDNAVTTAETQRLNKWFDEKYEEGLQFSPLTLTRLGRKELYDRIDDFSVEADERRLQWRIANTEQMINTFDYSRLTPEAQISWDLYVYGTERQKAGVPWRYHGYIFEQMGGAQTSLPNFLINFHQVDTEEDMRAYISRIGEMGRAYEQLLEITKESASRGIRPPIFAYEGALDQAQKLLSGAPFKRGKKSGMDKEAREALGDSALWADVVSEISNLRESGVINRNKAKELRSLAKTALTDRFEPAYQAVIDWLETDVANAVGNHGVWALPDGEAYYNNMLAESTTTDLSADEVHELGLAEVARLRGEMIAIKDATGFEGDLQAFFAMIRDSKDDPRFYYPDTDEGRQAYIDDATAAINNIKGELPNFFGLLPKAELIVKRVEPFRERDGAAQHYFAGTPDGSRPGIYYAHLSDMTAMPKNQLEVIAYHEGLPGHHMQISIAQELENTPKFRTQSFFTAYVEGWALYTEFLASEMPGAYLDHYSDFGRLTAEIWRAIRLVVDTGIHARQWTKQEAMDYFAANTPEPIESIEAEVERYTTWPGQATSYKIGMLKILELRKRAKAELGDEFDIRAFHDAVLGGGGLPLEILERRVNQWVEDAKGV